MVSESEKLLLKAEGIRDCVKWIEKEMKETKSLLNSCGAYSDEAFCMSERLNTQLKIKVSLEKYMKKLHHEAEEME